MALESADNIEGLPPAVQDLRARILLSGSQAVREGNGVSQPAAVALQMGKAIEAARLRLVWFLWVCAALITCS